MTPILRLLPWGIINGLAASFFWATAPRYVFIGHLVFSTWWLGGNVAHEISAAIKGEQP